MAAVVCMHVLTAMGLPGVVLGGSMAIPNIRGIAYARDGTSDQRMNGAIVGGGMLGLSACTLAITAELSYWEVKANPRMRVPMMMAIGTAPLWSMLAFIK